MSKCTAKSTRCFLCRQICPLPEVCKSINTPTISSKKRLKEVVDFVARHLKIELHVSPGELVCPQCHLMLVDFDSLLVQLSQRQRHLSELLEKAAADLDPDVEEECDAHMAAMEELNDGHFYDDLAISEKEISQAVQCVIKDSEEPQRRRKRRKSNTEEEFVRERKALFECYGCDERFNSKLRLHKHITQAHQRYNCELCAFSHRNEDYLLLHMNVHEGRNETQCRYCGKEFSTKISTIRHMEVHLQSKRYQCDKCGLCFSQTTVLYNHRLQHEAEAQPLQCELCKQVFKTKRTYRHHMITHRADRPRYNCEFCGKTFTEKYTLKVHKRSHHSEEPPPTDALQQSSPVHVELPPPVEEAPVILVQEAKFDCIICCQLFTSKEILNRHMEKEHDVILKSMTQNNFSQYEEVSPDAKKPCHICGHVFATQNLLHNHLEQMHGVFFC